MADPPAGIKVYGDGEQTRDFTFVQDAIDANLSTLRSDCVGQVFNIGGGTRAKLSGIIQIMQEVVGKQALLSHETVQKGDVGHTAADISKAQRTLGYSPKISLKDGIQKEHEWLLGL